MELLGLNPRRAYNVVLEMWVNMEDLYRPAPDPETSDHKAEVAARLDETINVWGLDCEMWVFPNPYLFFPPIRLTSRGLRTMPPQLTTTPRLRRIQLPEAPGVYLSSGGPRNHVGASEFMIKIRTNLDGQGTNGIYATYIRAIKDYDKSWSEYFHCGWRHDKISADNVPDADVNQAAVVGQ